MLIITSSWAIIVDLTNSLIATPALTKKKGRIQTLFHYYYHDINVYLIQIETVKKDYNNPIPLILYWQFQISI